MNAYILDGKTPVKCDDMNQWGKWFEKADRHVNKTMIGDIRVSTVFLGLDHSYDDGDPILFETMIFGGEHDDDMWRYSTWDEAEVGHKSACDLVNKEVQINKQYPDKNVFKLFGREFFYTHFFDRVIGYNFGGIIINDNGQFDTRTFWHKIAFGLYIRSGSYLRIVPVNKD